MLSESNLHQLFFAILLLIFVGCASNTRQTDQLLSQVPRDLTLQAQIPNVPFINQSVGHCGPATLGMVMHWNGLKTSVDQLVPQVYTPKVIGSFQTDMISAARRNSMMAIQIDGLQNLLQEIQAGHPVIIFENLGIEWIPQYHYAVVHGYDLNEKILVMHSGPTPNEKIDLREFERSWKLGDYWGLVVLPPGKLSFSGSEIAHLQAAAAFEKISKFDEAYLSYSAIQARWPESLGALIGLGNMTYVKKNFSQSAKILKNAVTFHPRSAIAWHNLALAEFAANQRKMARKSAQKAIELAQLQDKPQYESNLRLILD